MLFRREVLQSKKNRLTGNVILIQPLSLQAITFSVFLLFVASIVYATQSHYSRKETVKGYLIPQKGVVKVYSGRAGVLDDLLVVEGERVKQGQSIAKIRNSQSLASGVELSVALSQELGTQIDSLTRELVTAQVVFEKDERRIERQLDQLNLSLMAVERTKVTSQKRLELKEQRLINNRVLHDKGFLSSTVLATVEEEYLEALEASQRLGRDIATISVEIDSLTSEKLALPELLVLKQISIQRLVSELKAKRAELNNQYEFVTKAPETGIVTAIQPVLGAQLSPTSPILTIIPEDSPLEMDLLLPTRSAGFVEVGDSVRIRFDAFPYQKFGLAQGTVVNIDKSLVLPTETVLPVEINEAVYRVRASLSSQVVQAYGESFPLKIGMIANADIVIESRTLLEWLMAPIYSVRGKL
ncbi:HlyD family efflux transporter periplasmic adaptor subunit [Vibrio coralliirubri]|uniref:HlyD family efflux transporter periplasmic adaptor subunit n=1 Tax=Vibrio coralliirubri TaxID=1516159 RepID=UPI00073EC7B8|nr:HlyD family efflux transporter periplasmic adaptor subunit [Vibrio coralliirubri]